MHPENAGRLTAVVEYLKGCQKKYEDVGSQELSWAGKIVWVEPSVRDVLEDVCRVHDSDYIESLKTFAQKGGGFLDADTVMSSQSYALALLAVAAWLQAADWVSEEGSQAFALVRPPGHHAERSRGMGFCLLSNAAIAAHYALAKLGAQRVAILDWDVHHGNGTQSLVEGNPNIAYCSFHQADAYPGTGGANETGDHRNVLNLPMAAGAGRVDYQQRWQAEAAPFLRGFGADFMIVSAGYDATQSDPLAGLCLQPDDYGWLTQMCLQLTPKILFGLEGGYDYRALAESVAATIRCAVQGA